MDFPAADSQCASSGSVGYASSGVAALQRNADQLVIDSSFAAVRMSGRRVGNMFQGALRPVRLCTALDHQLVRLPPSTMLGSQKVRGSHRSRRPSRSQRACQVCRMDTTRVCRTCKVPLCSPVTSNRSCSSIFHASQLPEPRPGQCHKQSDVTE